ncbi:hypothetical protein ACS3SW_20800 [Roseobacteraceae bacterium S113]
MKHIFLLSASILFVFLVGAKLWFEASSLEHSRDAWRAYAEFISDAAASSCVTQQDFVFSAENRGLEVEVDGILLSTKKPEAAVSHLIVLMNPPLPFLETGNKERGEVIFFDQRGCWLNR